MDLAHFTRLVAAERGLCLVSVLRPDRTIQTTLVNAGLVAHPRTGATVVGFVARPGAHKLRHLRADPSITLAVRSGFDWATVDGTAEIVGADDAGMPAAIEAEGLRVLLRAVFRAAGGDHDDWDAYDRVMRAEGRVAVLVTPRRAYTNTPE